MATVELTKENFTQTITDNDMVLIDFWAAWCGPCKRFGPVFEAASKNHPDVVFAKLDTEAVPEIAQGLEIQSIPTLMALREGMLLYREAGALSAPQLEGLVTELKKVDMDKLRAEAAEHESSHADHDHEGQHSH